MFRELPHRFRIRNKIHMKDLPAAARTSHSGCPNATSILDYVKSARRGVVRFVIGALDSKKPFPD